ncbi:cobalamin-binding protein [Alkalibaculum sp. M08DMB]|uniref:Cobalamin-binding protein n=1 Tax=Alkalibaculum sporogenes TaxID=2655001 RepID=A0A6A7K9F8_9FIRM|nr:cobalamin-dependent protein [Alkalibaculum sporogenes]MPW26149.1 cobalamin-binding protein [Alkalibaculum sporogenes]
MDLQFLTKWVGELDEENVICFLNEFIDDTPSESDAQEVVAACQEGMAEVGELFEKGEYFVGDLIFAGELLTEAIELLKPVLGSDDSTKVGSIVLGTVHGDLHDIGKNIFRSMVEAAGFEVIDIGIDQPVSAFVSKVKEIKPDIVGMSGVLTLALEAMKDTVEGLQEAGLRDSVKIIIGGNPVTKESCAHIGADDFTNNAAEGVKICKEWIK